MKLHSFAFNYWHNMFLRFLDSSTLRSGMGLEAWEQFFSPFLRIDFTLYNPQELYHYIHFLGISWSDFNPQDLWFYLFITSYFLKKSAERGNWTWDQKSVNLQYGWTTGRRYDCPAVWWSNVCFDRLRIIQWDSDLLT